MERPKPPEHRDAQSDFLREAGPNDHVALGEGLVALTTLLPADISRPRGAERLARAVAELPLRYAPFFGRLSQLWNAPEERVLSELSRAKDPRAWTLTLLPGVKTFAVEAGARAGGQRSRLICFAPGVHFPRHRHRGAERVLVLEGSYADGDGQQVRAGEEQLMEPGSEHQLRVLGAHDCVAAVAEHGIEFTGPWLRWATKLLG